MTAQTHDTTRGETGGDQADLLEQMADGRLSQEGWYSLVIDAHAKALQGQPLQGAEILALIAALQYLTSAGRHLFLFRSDMEIVRAVLLDGRNAEDPLSDAEFAERAGVIAEVRGCFTCLDAVLRALRAYSGPDNSGFLARQVVLALSTPPADVVPRAPVGLASSGDEEALA